MSKLYISTQNCGKAHEADIFGLCISNPYTVTVSGDGSLKLWKNKLIDGEQPKDHVISCFVHKTGLHHVDAFHSVEQGGLELFLVACVSFSGQIFIYEVDMASGTLKELDLLSHDEKLRSYWCIKFLKSDDFSVAHKMVATDVKGSTVVWALDIFKPEEQTQESGNLDLKKEKNIRLSQIGEIPATEPKFATSVDVSVKGIIATGFQDGSVVVSQLETLRPIYNFEGFGIKGTEESSGTVRDVKFSPLGELLAVANDSGSYGCVTLYETEYGERVGNLTVPTHSSQTSIANFTHNGWVFNASFSSTGEFLATCGYDGKIRVWDVKRRERVSTLNISAGDIEIESEIVSQDEFGNSLKTPPVMGVTFINKGVRGGIGGDTNEGLACVCLDRSVRWFREAGGV
ncbi:LANO_0D01640g1_1 [Lachancea nothofagi CBS 11611]|uniref:LANO_0D01640g1_1 n=1 Tax=Lachancea nothofagi CBS 11611 TaxID=1266666 RepID=A0A1G4JDM3_9SACH|nr:LANO_0D01640g1_1 [Lachancea nothofagi CBS 11611]